MKISIIVAVTGPERAIGRRGDMIYHLRDDLRRFRRLTTGHPVIMGRKTFESLPAGALPDRRNIVISSNTAYNAPGAEMATSLEQALQMCRLQETNEVFVIGGARVYAEAMAVADCIYLTQIMAPEPDDADTFFPEIPAQTWTVAQASDVEADSRTGISHRFLVLERREQAQSTDSCISRK